MNGFFRWAGRLLRRTWLWSLLLVFAIALTVWIIGPLLAVDDYRFWQGSASRLLTISVLFLSWGLAMVFVSWRRVAWQGMPENSERRQRDALVEGEKMQVRGRFKEALHGLKFSRRYGEHGKRWRNELPWYLLIGDEGSGKTRLLAASGSPFPLDRNESPGQVGGTRYCDWYFADDGVLIDTAGRYLTQPHSRADAAGWSTLLKLLKARRRARPLNGVVVSLSMDALLHADEHALDTQARNVHNRLLEIQQTLHADLPVYLVVTQADRLPGFAEFFDGPQGEGSDALLGECLVDSNGGTDLAQVRLAFEALLQRLSGELIQRLHQERSSERRGRMLDFPHQAAGIGEGLCRFIEAAFCAHRYQHINGLRGFYLTSAGATETVERRGHFIQGFFSRVVFAESDLADLDPSEQRRIRRRHSLLALTSCLLIGAAGLVWAQGYFTNQQYLEQLRDLARPPTLAQSGTNDVLALLPLLDSRLAATRVFPSEGQASLDERVGLYQGDISRPVLESAYEQTLHQWLLSAVGDVLEEQVRANLEDRELLLESLRAYLMLNLPERRDADWLGERLADHWSVRYSADTATQNRLNAHVARLLERPFVQPLNDQLVAQARQVLRGEPLAGVVYRALREQARSLEPYRFSQHLDPQGRVFAGIDQPIPGFYTQRYWRYFEAQGAQLVDLIVQDNWVLGESSDLSPMDSRRLMVELEQRYFSDYADAWSEALGRIRLQGTETILQGIEQLASLTSAQSPLLQVLQQVREHTRFPSATSGLDELLTRVPRTAGVPGEVAQWLPNGVQRAMPHVVPNTARRALQRRFEPLHHLLDDQHNPGAEVTQVLHALNEVHLQLLALNREERSESAAFALVKRRMSGEQDPLGNLRNVTARLPLPLTGWLDGLADDTWRRLLEGAYRHVNQRYQTEVYGYYAKAIKQHYPFNAHAGSDVALNDFQAFFNPQGVMSRFIDNYLQPFITADANHYRLRKVDGQSLPMSRALLDQLLKAQRIRRSFFAEDQGAMQVRFTVAPYSLDPGVSRAILRVGDQQLEYRHGPIVPMVFQWPSAAENGRSSLVLERGAKRALEIEKNVGPWSLFRLFDLMQREPLNGQDAQILTSNVSGLRANYQLTSLRTPSAFDIDTWRTFRIPEQL